MLAPVLENTSPRLTRDFQCDRVRVALFNHFSAIRPGSWSPQFRVSMPALSSPLTAFAAFFRRTKAHRYFAPRRTFAPGNTKPVIINRKYRAQPRLAQSPNSTTFPSLHAWSCREKSGTAMSPPSLAPGHGRLRSRMFAFSCNGILLRAAEIQLA